MNDRNTKTGRLWRSVVSAILMQSLAVAATVPAPGLDTTIHRERAAEVMESIQDRFYLKKSGLYADKAGGTEPTMMWGCGVMFSALVGAARHDRKYERPMRKFFDGMDAYWDEEAEIPGYEPGRTQGGNDKYYDDNAWMVLTFLEAYQLTGQRRYKKRAVETLEFVLSGWDEEAGGGIWWHEQHKGDGKNTCINAPAALSCYRLARLEPPDKAASLKKWGDKLTVWTVKTFQAEDGLFLDSMNVKTGEYNRAKLTYNTGLMVRTFLALHVSTGESFYLEEAIRVGRAAEMMRNGKGTGYRDSIKFSHLMVEADLELYRMTGDKDFLERAVSSAKKDYEAWKSAPSDEIIIVASLARELYLLADLETPAGRAFWKEADAKSPGRR